MGVHCHANTIHENNLLVVIPFLSLCRELLLYHHLFPYLLLHRGRLVGLHHRGLDWTADSVADP